MSEVVRRNKTCEISVYLFGKPAWELDLEGEDANVQMAMSVRALGDELKERLYHASDILTKLVDNGWSGSGTLYDIYLFKDITVAEAEKELSGLGIDPGSVNIREDEWDDEEEDELTE
jgi:hypothetical protein